MMRMRQWAGNPGRRLAVMALLSVMSVAMTAGTALASSEDERAARSGRAGLVPRTSTVPGVGLVVDVPERMHPVTRATIDERGNVRLGRGSRHDAVRPRPAQDVE